MTDPAKQTENRLQRGLFGGDFDNLFEGFFRPIPLTDRQDDEKGWPLCSYREGQFLLCRILSRIETSHQSLES